MSTLRLNKGQRVQLTALDPQFLDVAAERRRGLVISTNSGVDIVLDEPLNVSSADMEQSLVNTYLAFPPNPVAEIIDDMKNYIVRITQDQIDSGEVVLEARTNDPPVESASYKQYIQSHPNQVGYCMKCEKAQRNSNLIITCGQHNHTVCKACLLPWNVENNRADMTQCAEYTHKMTEYCRNTLHYEPTCLATRILLGNSYFQTEDKRRSVVEFCDCDSVICWVCRFKKNDCTTMTSFRFLHEQIFDSATVEDQVAELGLLDEFDLLQFQQQFRSEAAVAVTATLAAATLATGLLPSAPSCSSIDQSPTSASASISVTRTQEELQSALTCSVCMENEKTVVLLPCRHMCVCEACAGVSTTSSASASSPTPYILKNCPLCRAVIEHRLSVFR